MPSAPNDVSGVNELRAVTQRNAPLIAAFVVVAVAISIVLSIATESQYDATAKLSFTDSSADVALVGVASAPARDPSQVASAGVSQVERSGVVRRVTDELGLAIPDGRPDLPIESRRERFADRLRAALSVAVEPGSNLVTVTVRWPDAAVGARLANLIATQTTTLVTNQTRGAYDRQAENLRQRFSRLGAGATRDERAQNRTQVSRLVALSSLAQPVQIVSRADPASSPSVPRPVFSAVVAAIIGLIVGLLVATARRSLDRRIREPSQLEGILGTTSVGTFPKAALGTAAPLVIDQGTQAHLLVDQARVLRANLVFVDVDRPPRTVTVTSAVEAEGKSTVAAALATAAALAGDRVMLVDADLRRPAIAARYGISREPGLTDFLAGQADPQSVMRVVDIPDTGGTGGGTASLTIVPAGTESPRPADLLSSERFKEFVAEVRDAYDLVVIDTAPLLPVPDTSAIVPTTDVVILCCRLGTSQADVFATVSDRLEHLQVEHPLLAVTGLTKKHGPGSGAYGYGYGYSAPSD